MARKAKGKPLTLRPIRLDDDVWAECQRLGKEFGTINEGLRAVLLAQLREEKTRLTVAIQQRIDGEKVGLQDWIGGYEQDKAIREPVEGRPFRGPLLKPSERGKK